jgi:hypothetical protein
MKTKILILAFFLFSICSFSQQLTYKSGRIFDENNKKLSNSEVRNLLSSQQELLNSYNEGRTKATVGGLLFGFGGGLVVADLLTGATQDKVYPSALTYVGLLATVIAIPVTIGHSKKTKSAIEGYNKSLESKKIGFSVEKINIISSSNGIGMQISF